MLRGIFALFFRSLRGDSRSIWVHALWFFLLVVIYVAMSITQAQEVYFGAPGLLFFQYVIYCNAVFVTLLGISYFSSAISEEKEEDTLGLMTMAGISPLGILLGKSTTRLFQVFLLLAVQYPFTLLAITLGGLAREQILSAYAALLAFTILLANVGLFCSVICRRNRSASGLTTLWMIGYGFAPVFSLITQEYLHHYSNPQDPDWMAASARWQPFLTWIYETSIFVQLYSATETGHQFSWTPQLISNSIGGVVLFLLSWWSFGFLSHESSVEATTRAMVPRRTGRLRWFSAGRAWDAALVWKDFHFIAGGWVAVFIRGGLYIGLYWLCFASNRYLDGFNAGYSTTGYPTRWHDVTVGYQIFVVPLFVVDCSLCMSRLFHEEIRLQTLASLLMLPRSVPHIFYMKLAGCLAALVPGMIAVFTAFVLLTEMRSSLMEAIKEPTAWWLVANMLLLIHLCAMLSAYLRWGAFAMSFALTIGAMIISGMLVETMMLSPGGRIHSDVIFGLLTVPVLLACAGCHLTILLRLPALGEK